MLWCRISTHHASYSYDFGPGCAFHFKICVCFNKQYARSPQNLGTANAEEKAARCKWDPQFPQRCLLQTTAGSSVGACSSCAGLRATVVRKIFFVLDYCGILQGHM